MLLSQNLKLSELIKCIGNYRNFFDNNNLLHSGYI
jgi:hypothetical protein